MKFHPTIITHGETGATANVFLSDESTEFERGEKFARWAAAVEVDGDPRLVSYDALKMMVAFNRSLERRTQLRHDCTVFALACTLGNDFEDRVFDPLHRPIQIDDLHFSAPYEGASLLQEPQLSPGQVALTVNTSPLDPGFTEERHAFHFMVRATGVHDLRPPLYLSKFGPQGPVALHDFWATREFYPAVAAGSVGTMRLIE